MKLIHHDSLFRPLPALARLCLVSAVMSLSVYGQTSNPEPDVLIFNNGEKLIGHLVRSTGASVTFKSDMAGEVTAKWADVKELNSSQRFAVVRKDEKVGKRAEAAQLPRGTVRMAGQKVELNPGAGQAAQMVPVENTAYLIDEPTLEKDVLHNPGFLEGWKGSAAAGVSLVEATQNSRTVTTNIGLVRSVPGQSWLDPRNRTIVDFSASYGKVSQPATPTVKTAIYHADAERDEYFTDHVYGFGQGAFDHNFSQGLDLQQAYGGGIGWTVLSNPRQTLDLKGSMSFIDQQFQDSTKNQKLVGSTFSERFLHTFARGIIFSEQLSATPAWNNTSAYSAAATAGLAMPVRKRLSLNMNIVDTFLNDPPPGFKKNSFQFITGFAYALP